MTNAVLPLSLELPRAVLERIEWQVQADGPALCGNCGGMFNRADAGNGHRLGCEVAIALGRLPALGELQPGTDIPCPTCRELARRGVLGHPQCYDAWAKGEGETQTA